MENKRLFLGFEVIAPWPEQMPAGRVLLEQDRHLTIAFLGSVNWPQLQVRLSSYPEPPFRIGLSGMFDRPLFLPVRSPRVAAWRIRWLEEEKLFLQFQKTTVEWCKESGFPPRDTEGEFLSHVTIVRRPFRTQEWKKTFAKLPLYIRNLCLYESLGGSHYKTLWVSPLLAPFEEKEHTADLAFTIRGTSLRQMHLHAQLALSFHFPPLLDFIICEEMHDLGEIVRSLNILIGKVDQELGSPFKAVSYHGKVIGQQILEWEMIVDV